MMKSALLILVIVLIYHGPVRAADRIKIAATAMSATYLTVYVAQDQGFFEKEGLNAEIMVMKAPTVMAALINGELDYTLLFGGLVVAAIRGLPVKVVAGYVDAPTFRLISQPNIRSVKDLRGKTIAVGTLGTLSHVTAQMILKHFGVDPEKEVKFTGLNTDAGRFTALQQRTVDAIVSAPPADTMARKLGYNVLAAAHDFFTYPMSGLGLSVKKIEERRDEVKRVIKATVRANRYIRENRDGSVRVLMKWTKVDGESAASIYDSVRLLFNEDGGLAEEGLRLVIEESRKQANVDRKVALGEVADLTVLREAQRELGIKGK